MINLEEYIKQIELNDVVKEHLLYTYDSLEELLKKISVYPSEIIDLFLYDATIKENMYSAKMERSLYSPGVIDYYEQNFSAQDYISEEMIKNLNQIVLHDRGGGSDYNGDKNPGEYRKSIAWVGRKDGKSGIENARYVAPVAELVPDYMDQFIKFYNDDNIKDPFIKGAMVHIIFIKIHPFSDGNGRIARILHHHILTSMINKKYSTDFKWPIINLSRHLDLTRGNYYNNENNILFSIDSLNVETFNKWFDYLLNMVDENIYVLEQRLKSKKTILDNMGDNIGKIL